MSLWTQAIAGPLAAAVAAMPPGRRLVALAGPPGAGKSTLAAEAAAVLPGATVLPMDGYHLDDAILAERGILHRKGSPESFDAAGFLSLVRRLRDEAEVFHPVFDRTREQSIAGAGRVGPEHRLVLVEGNYLLVDEDPWALLSAELDEAWFCATPGDERFARLVGRHTAGGRAPDAAEAWAREVDGANAALIEGTRGRADLVVAGCAILEAILDIWPAPRLGVADRGIREGILRGLMSADADGLEAQAALRRLKQNSQ